VFQKGKQNWWGRKHTRWGEGQYILRTGVSCPINGRKDREKVHNRCGGEEHLTKASEEKI